MPRTLESSLDDLTLILDQLVREFVATNDKDRRSEIANEISVLTVRLSAISSTRHGFAGAIANSSISLRRGVEEVNEWATKTQV